MELSSLLSVGNDCLPGSLVKSMVVAYNIRKYNKEKYMKYEDLIFKIPKESVTYKEDSDFVIRQIIGILDRRKKIGDDKIIINTN